MVDIGVVPSRCDVDVCTLTSCDVDACSHHLWCRCVHSHYLWCRCVHSHYLWCRCVHSHYLWCRCVHSHTLHTYCAFTNNWQVSWSVYVSIDNPTPRSFHRPPVPNYLQYGKHYMTAEQHRYKEHALISVVTELCLLQCTSPVSS